MDEKTSRTEQLRLAYDKVMRGYLPPEVYHPVSVGCPTAFDGLPVWPKDLSKIIDEFLTPSVVDVSCAADYTFRAEWWTHCGHRVADLVTAGFGRERPQTDLALRLPAHSIYCKVYRTGDWVVDIDDHLDGLSSDAHFGRISYIDRSRHVCPASGCRWPHGSHARLFQSMQCDECRPGSHGVSRAAGEMKWPMVPVTLAPGTDVVLGLEYFVNLVRSGEIFALMPHRPLVTRRDRVVTRSRARSRSRSRDRV